ncbi:MAG: hypothetical protein Q9219_006431 [cf. Caloplaca sp. 3 TL-2023]
MPWSRLRRDQPDRRRRRSVLQLDPSGPAEHEQDRGVNNGREPDSLQPARLSTSVSDLMLQEHNLHATVSNGQDPSPYGQHPPTNRSQRFSLLKFRHASDSQLSRTARDQALTGRPPVPTGDNPSSGPDGAGLAEANPSARASRITFDEPERLRASFPPPAYGDDANSTLALPVSRLSESSRSDGSSGEHGVYATTTTTHTVSTTTTFFRIPRRKKNKGPLFPLPVKIPPPASSPEHTSTPRLPITRQLSHSPTRHSTSQRSPLTAVPRSFVSGKDASGRSSPLPSPSRVPPGVSFAASAYPNLRRDSTASTRSGRSSPALAAPAMLGKRGRSSTKGSAHGNLDEEPLPTPPLPQSGRTSTSTGRASLGGLFSLSRLRQNSEPQPPRHGSNLMGAPGTPISSGSKSHSLSFSRELFVMPEREEGDTPARYLVRLEEAVNRGAVAAIVSKSDDEFSKNVLRSYMRGFRFFGDPLDMSIRKLLMEAELPRETQQIDRVLQAFANRYHECNPGIYASPGRIPEHKLGRDR